jgi:hypothetical protein
VDVPLFPGSRPHRLATISHQSPTFLSHNCLPKVKSKSEAHYGRRSVGQPAPSGVQDQFFVTVRKLRLCRYGAPSFMRGRVCHLPRSKSVVYTYVINVYNFICRRSVLSFVKRPVPYGYLLVLFTVLHVTVIIYVRKCK